MEPETLSQEIAALIAALGDETALARPAEERALVEKVRAFLEITRRERTGAHRAAWEACLPYTARRCAKLAQLEEGWEEEREFFASENGQFWVDNAAARLEAGDLEGCAAALAQVIEAARLMKRDRIAQVEVLLAALDAALELGEKKLAVCLYEEAEKIHRKHLAGGHEYAGSAWLPKIRKLGARLNKHKQALRRFFHYAETITVSIEAASEAELEQVLNTLQEQLPGRVTVTRRPKAVEDDAPSAAERRRARVRFTLE